MIHTLRYRARYYWRKLITFFGICPDCRTPLNQSIIDISPTALP